ncbi:DUF488 domain-containing protein [Tomitella fengzijianii]|uniref:DUF488 family protein n=1 Tax=Tomitella fengzijianii TaxID=2597660 RepID=A0A516X6V4_9ACTN|nr:DUF488 family protein [Tomitella fengzijianii]QDQ98780.1 DUF488 family protein [Tomitella fengzijianii]
MGQISLVRVYEATEGHPQHDEVAAAASGPDRPSVFLVDRVWPRGVSKVSLPFDEWVKDVAPTTDLRKWFGHDPGRFAEFSERYRAELDGDADGAAHVLVAAAKDRDIVLLYSAKDEEHNQAVVLRRWINDKR